METKGMCSLASIATAALLAVFPAALGSQQASSVYIHGGNAEALVNNCAAADKMLPKDAPGLSYCFGYILGVVDMHNALNAVLASPKDNTYCIPDNATATQLAKVLVKYGNDHPEDQNQAALFAGST